MRRYNTIPFFVVLCGLFFPGGAAFPGAQASAAPETDFIDIQNDPSLQSGLVLHIGCGNGERTLDFIGHDSQSVLVLGLDRNMEHVQQARKRIREEKLYGKVIIIIFLEILFP